MQIRIGDKIRELRRRDGRKQEDLANALGVTNQAVSRWEANGGYPDMEMLPAIANYFHVSIDELFGYSKDREEKLKSILDRAEKALNEQGDMTDCVEMLREAADEFPTEPGILIKLGYALSLQGWKKYGARCYTKDGSDYSHEDTEYNSKNEYWQEEVKVFEKVLTMDIPTGDREVIVMMLIVVYAQMGYNDKAKELANKQNSLIMSRELLLYKATASEERDKYLGEAVISLLTELKNVIIYFVNSKISLFSSDTGVDALIDLVRLYESVFGDGRCGYAHMHIRDLYLYASMHIARHGDTDKAFEYFEKCFEHNTAYKSIRCGGEYKYTAPLVSKVTFPSENFPAVPDDFWKINIDLMTNALKDRIRGDSRFDECFK